MSLREFWAAEAATLRDSKEVEVKNYTFKILNRLDIKG